MDLFTYLMAKNGHNTSINEDLFAYLLGKAQGGGGQIKTASGITIYIPDATKKKLVSFMFTKESTQETNILPSGYTQVDYIESSGLERINTGVDAKGTLHVSIEFETATELQGSAIFGGRTTSSSKSYCFWSTGNDTFRTDYNNEARTINVVSTAGKFLVDKNRGTTTIKSGSNIYTDTQTNSTFTSEVPITLFACNSNGSIIYHSTYKLYKCDIYDNDVLVRQFIPCYRNSDNEVGLYDLVNDVFYTNQGTGAFTYGSVASLPNPDYPQEVNVVEGYRNLFDKDNANILNAILGPNKMESNSNDRCLYISCKPNTTYTIRKLRGNRFRVATTSTVPTTSAYHANRQSSNNEYFVYSTNGNANYLIVNYWTSTDTITEQQMLDSIMIVEGEDKLPYVPYGSNYIAVNVSNGTNTNKYPIPLNNNIIAGIGDYKDELKVDKSGNVFINKKTGKIILDGSENWSRANASDGNRFLCSIIRDKVKIPASTSTIADILCDRFISESANDTNSSINGMGIASSGNIVFYYDVIKNYTTTQTKEWFTLNNTEVYYVLATPELIDLQTTVDIEIFKGVNNISNSEDGYMTIEYR